MRFRHSSVNVDGHGIGQIAWLAIAATMRRDGAHLGPYEILAAIGAGGMGEVYRARDTRLKREVAIKLLPEAFTADLDHLSLQA
jgi:serine/threonine protein kinase